METESIRNFKSYHKNKYSFCLLYLNLNFYIEILTKVN